MISLEGAFDLHVHSSPDIFPRIGDDVALAQACLSWGMSGFALKCHVEGTSSRAYYVNKMVPGFQAVGGVTLNYAVGGINPAAVDASLRLGGRIVWMPSGHSRHHADIKGSVGSWGAGDKQLYNPPGAKGVTVLGPDGVLTPEALDVVALVQEHDALLATSHLSPQEILALLDLHAQSPFRILINHPMYLPKCDIDFVIEVVERGAFVEVCSVTIGGYLNRIPLDKALEIFRKVPHDRIVLASDGGGIQSPSPHESLRAFATNLVSEGVPEANIRRMLVDAPLGLIS